MAFTKINAAGIGTTETVTVDGLTVINDGSFGGNLTVGGVLTYEDVTNVDSVGLITARNGIVVGSGITLSKDGDIFATGVTTSTTFVGALTGNVTGNVTGNISGGTVSGTTGTFTGDVDIADKIVHTGDTDTAIRFSAADTISIETGGVTRATVTGNTIDFPDAGTLRFGASNDLQIYHGSGGASNIIHSNTSQPLIINASGAGTIRFDTNSSERVRITSDGQFLVGTTSSSYHFHVDDDDLAAEISIDNDASNFKTALNTTNSVNADFNIQHKANLTSIGTGVNVPLAFHINGGTNANSAEKMRLDSSGRILIGGGATATPKASTSGLDVSSALLSIVMGGSSGSNYTARANSTQKEARLVIPHYTNAEEPMVAIAAFASSASNQLNLGGGTSLGNVATEINFHIASNTTTTGNSQAWQIASDGDLIGSSPAVIHSGSSSGYLELYGGATNHGGKILMNGGNDDATIRFYSQTGTSSPGERLRISGVRVLHQCTSATGGNSSGVYVQEYLGHVYNAVKIRDTANTGTANVLVMVAGSSVSGTITQNGSSASFNTSSDYRLKENEVEISDGISRVKNLKPYKFNWKSDPTKIVDGFFAHEAQAVVPESVTGEKDEVADSDIEGKGIKKGDEIHQVMDHSKLVPLLTAALKEAITKIETLETKVAALEG